MNEISPLFTSEPPEASATQNTSLRQEPPQVQPLMEPVFLREEDEDIFSLSSASDGFVAPFQLSGTQPVVESTPPVSARSASHASIDQRGGAPISPSSRGSTGPVLLRVLARQKGWWRVAVLVGLILLLLGGVGFTALAQRPASLTLASPSVRATVAVPVPRRTPILSATPAPSQFAGSSWIPLLPPGWTTAGRTMSDALFAERTAWTFTDREMSLDFRNVGTRAKHNGTLTAATFVLTPAALQRFFQNDVRVINNRLFDRVTTLELVQAVINPVPHLVKFEQVATQQFAWVDVSFSLWISQLEQGKHREGIEMDAATRQARVHHMAVLLLRFPLGMQGPNAPMGGTGWLVSNYALDLPGGTLPDLAG